MSPIDVKYSKFKLLVIINKDSIYPFSLLIENHEIWHIKLSQAEEK